MLGIHLQVQTSNNFCGLSGLCASPIYHYIKIHFKAQLDSVYFLRRSVYYCVLHGTGPIWWYSPSRFSLLCLYCVRWNHSLQITGIKFVTIKFVWSQLNPAFNLQSKANPMWEQEHKQNMTFAAALLGGCKRSGQGLARLEVSAIVRWVCFSLFCH